MASLFGDSSSSDEEENGSPQPHSVIKTLVTNLLGRALPLSLADLRHSITATSTNSSGAAATPATTATKKLADSLDNILLLIIHESDWTSKKVVETLKYSNEQSSKFMHQVKVYKEIYLLTTMVQIGTFDALGMIDLAFEQLDHAFVLGGPLKLLRSILSVLQKKREVKCDTSNEAKEDDQRLWSASATPVNEKRKESIEDSSIPHHLNDLSIMQSWYNGTLIEEWSSSSTTTSSNVIEPIDFYTTYYKKEKPVVLKNLTNNWKALEKWSKISYWKRYHGHRTVPMEVGRHHENGWKEEWVRINDFLEQYIIPSNNKIYSYFNSSEKRKRIQLPAINQVGYIAQHTLIDQLPMLLDDFIPPTKYCQICNNNVGITKINGWFGTDGTITPLHYDSYDNFLVQIVGYKYIRLYDRSQTSKLYVASETSNETKENEKDVNKSMSQNNISPVDVENYNEKEYPLFSAALFTEYILKPGDTLFIPDGCWHYVRSLSCSFSLNFWF